MMGQSVLSNQLIAGLLPELKRKMAYLEGATFSELWQKARFEEARLLDLARTQPRPPAAPWKQRPPRDNSQRQEEQWKQRPPQDNLQRYERPPQNLAGGHAGDGQRRNLQFVRCYNCNKAGHLAKDCRSIRQMGEAPARTQNQSAPKTSNWNAGTRAAAVVSVQGEGQSHNEEEPLKWMYEMYGILQLDVPPHDTHLRLGPTLSLTVKLDGIPVEALIDTGCPATIISREICRKILDKEREEAQPLSLEQWKEKAAKRLKQPSLLLKAYCGTELSIGAEIAVQVATPHHAVNSIVLVQKDTPVHMLLGTDLMSALGIKVLDDDGRSLLVPDNEEPLPVQVMEQPQPVQVMEQPQPVQVMEQPLPVQVMEQPQPVEVVEQPQPVGVVEQTQPVGVVEQPQPVPVNRCPAHTEVQLESQQKPQRSTTIVLQPQQVDDTSSHDLKSLSPCLKIGKRRYPVHGFSDYGRDPESTHKTPDTEIDQKSLGARRIPVRLIQACKLPGRCGKLLKAKRQKYQHDRRATSHKYQIGERVFVYQPSAAQGKARKFARPFHGPYRILELTPTNASVRPVDKPGEAPIFVSLDRVRRCPHEIPDQSWLGPAKRKSRTRKKRRRIEKPELPTISPEVSTQGAWSGRLRPRASEMQPREM